MTTGNLLYLLMSIGMFAAFSAVLAYESWQQSRLRPEVVPVPRSVSHDHDEAHDRLAA